MPLPARHFKCLVYTSFTTRADAHYRTKTVSDCAGLADPPDPTHAAVTDGSVAGTVGGAALGGVIGHQISR